MGSEMFIAAIAIGGVMFNMLYWLFSFLRAGTSGLSAQAFGAGKAEASTLVLCRSLTVAIVVGLLMILLQQPIFLLLSWFLDAGETTNALASTYFHILIFGAPAVLGNYAMSGWYLGMQNSRMLLWVSLIINTVNIASSLLLVYCFGLGIAGVAAGSLIAQWVGFAAGFLFLSRYKLTKISLKAMLRWQELRRFFSINLDVMLRTACMIAVTLWFTRAGSLQGPLILAVNTLLMQLFLLFSYMMDGFAFAAEALVGRYVGASDRNNVTLCIKMVFRWGIACAMLFTLLYLVGGEQFLALLSNVPAVISASKSYYLWAAVIPFAGFAAFVWDGVFIGATMTRGLLLTMFGAMLTFFITYFVLKPWLGNHALWLAFNLYLIMRGALQLLYYRKKADR
jgi:MATE family multidrug resistance protein